jgi:integrase
MSRAKNPEGIHGTRNLNGMGNLYLNKTTGRIEYKITENGRTRMATGKTAKAVNERKKALETSSGNKSKVKFHNWVEMWLETYVKPLKKASTHKQYEDTWKCYVKPYIKNIPLKTVTTLDIQKIIAKMKERNLSSYTMKQVRKVLNLAFGRALKEKYIDESPVKDIEIPAIQQKPRKTLKIDELRIALNYLKKSRWYWPFLFMLVTGLRRGELLALRWSDINEENKLITVEDNLTDQGIGTTKSNKVHYVSLSGIAQNCLKHFAEKLKREGNPAVFNNEAGIIFVSKKGTPLSPHSLNNVFRRIQEKAGVMATPHSMRHSFVYYGKRKMTIPEIKDILGHDETTSTMDIYGDMLFDTTIVASKIDQAFGGVIREALQPKKDNVSGIEKKA